MSIGQRSQMVCPKPDAIGHDKWQLFEQVCIARKHHGVSDRDLSVLHALLTFHPNRYLQDDTQMTVFPSNKTLSTRAHGMAESTLRRHLAALVRAGLIERQNSPNGKRYAKRGAGGVIRHAYGFNLGPLVQRAVDIAQAAQMTQEHEQHLRDLRDEILILRWEIEQSAQAANNHDLVAQMTGIKRVLRRKLDGATLAQMHGTLREIHGAVIQSEPPETEKTSATNAQNERHNQSSDKDISEEKTETPSLSQITTAVPDLKTYFGNEISTWDRLFQASGTLSAMIGVTKQTWAEAIHVMGPKQAAIAVVCILQRGAEIKSPGAYLRRLVQKASLGDFTVGPMVNALLNQRTVNS